MSEEVPVLVVGGGVVGCAIAYELSRSIVDRVFVVERNGSIRGENQSSRNSGVIHAGIYYPQKTCSLKARLCVEGNRMLYEFCEKHGVPYKKTGKLVVATNPREEEYLARDILMIAQENNVPDVAFISGREVKKLEPNVVATSALFVPTSGIVDATGLVNKLHMLAESRGAVFVTGTEVVNVAAKGEGFDITTRSGGTTETFEARFLINAAGLYSDRIAKMVNPDSPYEIDPVRGESAKFYKTKRADIFMSGMNVYPAPYGYYNNTGEKADVGFDEFRRLLDAGIVAKAVGIHLTPTFDVADGRYVLGSTVTVGPTTTVGIGREDYSSNLREADYYAAGVRRFFPHVRAEDLLPHQAGIRAKLKGHSDFVIERDERYPRCIHLVGIDSPGLTSSLSIASYVASLVRDIMKDANN